MCSPCPNCQGAGLIKSPQTICYELLEEARRLAKGINGDKDNKQVTLRINPDVAKALRTSERDVMIEMLTRHGFRCHVPSGAYYVMTDVAHFGFPDDVAFAK